MTLTFLATFLFSIVKLFVGLLLQAMSPDGEAIVTGAGDETLRFWNVFSKTHSNRVSLASVAMPTHASCLLFY